MSSTTSLDDIAEAIGDLATHIDQRFEAVDERFDSVDQRFNVLDRELASIRREHREMRELIISIDNRLGGLESDIAEIYDRIVVLEAKGSKRTKADQQNLQADMIRLMSWATKVSKQTGIVLPKI